MESRGLRVALRIWVGLVLLGFLAVLVWGTVAAPAAGAHQFFGLTLGNFVGKTVLGIFFIDVDHFKQINDTLGHEMGDTVLQETAHRLIDCLRASDTVARLSGDEFVALVETNRRSELTTVADAVHAKIHGVHG